LAKRKSTIQAKQSVEETFEQIIRADLAHINKWAPIAFEGKDIEGVHQMRVGLRRMRSALNLFSPAIPRKITKKLAKEMRWAARQLDRARDLDVYIADNLSSKESKNDKWKKLFRKVALRHRQRAYKQVRSFIKGQRYGALNEKLTRWLNTKGWRQGLSKGEKNDLAREITLFTNQVLDDHLCKVLSAGRNIQRMDDEALHRLRIECKKLRYATEFFSPLYGQEMALFSRQLKQLQDVLGVLHDCFVMGGLQSSLLKGKKSKKLAGVASKLMDQRKKSALDLKEVLFGSWESFIATRLPWLG
jgi:CHAD domain-containing protein